MAAGAVHLAAGGFALAEEQGIWLLAACMHWREGWAMAAGAVHLAAGGFALAEEQGIWRLACLRSLPTGSENWHWRC